MKLFLYCVLLVLTCAGTVTNTGPKSYSNVEVDTLVSDNISIRSILLDRNKIFYAGSNSKYGSYDLKTGNHLQRKFSVDSLEFRSIASNKKSILFMNVGSPAYLVKADKKMLDSKTVYRDNHEKAFYDSMQFWNQKEGIAVGDPIDGCFSVIITRDGGESWNTVKCTNLPAALSGEAAFAASNSNIVIKNNKTWIVSGGTKARVFYSGDKGKTWNVVQSPIIEGKTMTGIFSADFYNKKIGVIAGGDYENQLQNSQNKALTVDGGKTWKLVGENNGPGYISCVQFVPGKKGRELVTVGATGLYYSADSGNTWKLMHSDNSLYTIRFLNSNTAISAGRNKIIRIRFK